MLGECAHEVFFQLKQSNLDSAEVVLELRFLSQLDYLIDVLGLEFVC